jgi:hypothetical protein
MSKIKKLIIYCEPAAGVHEYVKSFTLAFSRINKEDKVYKKKAVLQHNSKSRNCVEEYKMKEIHTDADVILDKIAKIDFEKEYSPIVDGADKFYITYDDNKIQTSNKEEIQYILDLFNVDKLMNISHKHYEYIKDMDEYTILLDTLNSKLPDLDGNQIKTLSRTFKYTNPYNIFQSMSWLPIFLDNIANS